MLLGQNVALAQNKVKSCFLSEDAKSASFILFNMHFKNSDGRVV